MLGIGLRLVEARGPGGVGGGPAPPPPPPPAPAYDPASLFAGGAAGVWYDPSDLATLFQDVGGTVPAVVDAPVGLMLDRSGRGNHGRQSVAGSRPMLRREADGRYALEFDGVDDFLNHGFGGGGGDLTLSVAARRTGGSGVTGLFSATAPGARLQAGIASMAVGVNWGTYVAGAQRSAGFDAAAGIVMTAVGRANPDTQRLLTNGAAAVDYSPSYGGDGQDRRTVGREFNATQSAQFAGRLYALLGLARALDGTELDALAQHQKTALGAGL